MTQVLPQCLYLDTAYHFLMLRCLPFTHTVIFYYVIPTFLSLVLSTGNLYNVNVVFNFLHYSFLIIHPYIQSEFSYKLIYNKSIRQWISYLVFLGNNLNFWCLYRWDRCRCVANELIGIKLRILEEELLVDSVLFTRR